MCQWIKENCATKDILKTMNFHPGIFNKSLIDHLILLMSIKKFQSRIIWSPWWNGWQHERYSLSVDVYQIIPIKNYLIHFGCTGSKEKVELGLGLGLYVLWKVILRLTFLDIDFNWLLIKWHIVVLGIVVVCDQAIAGCKDIFNG